VHGLDPKNITQDRILQISATHTAEEIASKVNTGLYPNTNPLTPKLVYHRIHTACRSIATRKNITFDMVKAALNTARIESGVKARINATLGRGTPAEAYSDAGPLNPNTKQPTKQPTSDASFTDLDDLQIPPSYLSNFFSSQTSAMGAKNPLFKRIAKGSGGNNNKLPENEDLLLLASKHTIKEIVEMVQAQDAMTTVTNTKVSARIMDALTLMATARELPREVVKREFEVAKQANGVVKRHYGHVSSRRKAGTRAKREGKRVGEEEIEVPGARKGSRGVVVEEEDLNPVERSNTPPEALFSTPDAEDEDEEGMSDGSDDMSDATLPWLESPTFAKFITRELEDPSVQDGDGGKDDGKECLTREEAARILLNMAGRLSEEEDAALILMEMSRSEDVRMGNT
jgi:hypothetical protein